MDPTLSQVNSRTCVPGNRLRMKPSPRGFPTCGCFGEIKVANHPPPNPPARLHDPEQGFLQATRRICDGPPHSEIPHLGLPTSCPYVSEPQCGVAQAGPCPRAPTEVPVRRGGSQDPSWGLMPSRGSAAPLCLRSLHSLSSIPGLPHAPHQPHLLVRPSPWCLSSWPPPLPSPCVPKEPLPTGTPSVGRHSKPRRAKDRLHGLAALSFMTVER